MEQPQRRTGASGPGRIPRPGPLNEPQPQHAEYGGEASGQYGSQAFQGRSAFPKGGGPPPPPEQSVIGRLLSSSGSSSLYSGIVGGMVGGIVGLVLYLAMNSLFSPGREGRQILLAIVVPGMVALAVLGWPELVAGHFSAAMRKSSRAMLLAIAGGVIGLIIADWIYFTAGGSDVSDQTARLVLASGFAVVAGTVGFATGLDESGRRGLIGLGGGLLGGLLAGAVLIRLGGTREMESSSLLLAIPVGTLVLGAAVGGAERLGRQTWVEIVDGAMAGREINLYRNPSTIGSSGGADVVLADPGVAARHASIVRHGDVIWIDNLSPGLETQINQLPLNGRVELGPQDLVRIGNTYLLVKSR